MEASFNLPMMAHTTPLPIEAEDDHSLRIAALRERTFWACTPEELSTLWDEMEDLRAILEARVVAACGNGSPAPAPAYPAPFLPATALPQVPCAPATPPVVPFVPTLVPTMPVVPAEIWTSPRSDECCAAPMDWPSPGGSTSTDFEITDFGTTSFGDSLVSTPCEFEGGASDDAPLELQELSLPVVVKNTFIEVKCQADCLDDGFFKARQVRSCPCSPREDCMEAITDTDCLGILMAAAARLRCHKTSGAVVPSSKVEDGQHDVFASSFQQDVPQDVQQDLQHQAEDGQHDVFSSDIQQDVQQGPPGLTLAAAPPANNAEPVPVLRLAEVIGGLSDPLPSMGSADHRFGTCKPCAFIHTKGCKTGKDCKFCHLCEAGSSKRRKKEWRLSLMTMGCPRPADVGSRRVPSTVALQPR